MIFCIKIFTYTRLKALHETKRTFIVNVNPMYLHFSQVMTPEKTKKSFLYSQDAQQKSTLPTDHHYLAKITESSLTVRPASSLCTRDCVLLDPMDQYCQFV